MFSYKSEIALKTRLSPSSSSDEGDDNRFSTSSTSVEVSNEEYTLDDIYNINYVRDNPLWKLLKEMMDLNVDWNENEKAKDIWAALEDLKDIDYDIVALGIAYHNSSTVRKQYIKLMLEGNEGKDREKFTHSQSAFLRRRTPELMEGFPLTGTHDVLALMNIPDKVFFLFYLIQLIQFVAYISIYLSLKGESNATLSTQNVFAMIFSGVSLSMSAMENVTPVLSSFFTKRYLDFVKGKDRETWKDTWDFFKNFIMRANENILMVLFFATSVELLPTQADALDIILNCTALATISQLDEQVMNVWKWKLRNCLVMDLDKMEDHHIQQWKIRELSMVLVICLVAPYFLQL